MMRFTAVFFASALLVSCQCTYAFPSPVNGTEQPVVARVYTACAKPKTIAVTFDDGPNTYTKTIVDTLDKAGGKTTFFFNGDLYGCIYNSTNAARVKYAFDHGHQVASHTWAHLHLPALTDAEITSEFKRTNDALKKITGAVPAFVRPPFGEYNTNVQNVSGLFKQSLVNWDFDSKDWNGVAQIEADYKSRFDANPSNILALNHETYETSAKQVLPWVIDYAKSKGYKLVTVADCLGVKPYLSRGPPSRRDASWAC